MVEEPDGWLSRNATTAAPPIFVNIRLNRSRQSKLSCAAMFFPRLSPELPAFDSARKADLDLHAVRVLEKDGGQFARLVAVLAQDDDAFLGVALYGLLDIIGNKSVMVHALFVFRLHKL